MQNIKLFGFVFWCWVFNIKRKRKIVWNRSKIEKSHSAANFWNFKLCCKFVSRNSLINIWRYNWNSKYMKQIIKFPRRAALIANGACVYQRKTWSVSAFAQPPPSFWEERNGSDCRVPLHAQYNLVCRSYESVGMNTCTELSIGAQAQKCCNSWHTWRSLELFIYSIKGTTPGNKSIVVVVCCFLEHNKQTHQKVTVKLFLIGQNIVHVLFCLLPLAVHFFFSSNWVDTGLLAETYPI